MAALHVNVNTVLGNPTPNSEKSDIIVRFNRSVWILRSASSFKLFQYAVLAKVYGESLISNRYVLGEKKKNFYNLSR